MPRKKNQFITESIILIKKIHDIETTYNIEIPEKVREKNMKLMRTLMKRIINMTRKELFLLFLLLKKVLDLYNIKNKIKIKVSDKALKF